MKQIINKLENHLKNDQRLPLPDVEAPKLLEVKYSLVSKIGRSLTKIWVSYIEANKSFVKAHTLSEQHYWK